VTLVLKTRQLPPVSWLTEEAIQELQSLGVKGLSLHLNLSAGRRMFAKGGWYLLWGNDYTFNDDGLRYGRTSFSQLLPGLHNQSLDEATTFLNLHPGDRVIDLYCGIGSSLVRWINSGAHTIGIESGGEAVECALYNAPGATIMRGACRQRIPQLQQWLKANEAPQSQIRVYANPPRTGIETEVLEWIAGNQMPCRMVYLSCSAGTLRRDLDYLVSRGFEIIKIVPYDFFPQTRHVECMVMLESRSESIGNR
jgi:tRNA/tmRNA/rRNA uracil-C5-methylase (TrmA/RlmC/RlmD family)